jgi:tetratricopeptide (TPR) repeat protein/ADP-heptose:LPS heptosyltransferase
MNRQQRRASSKKSGTASFLKGTSPSELCDIGRRYLQAGQHSEAAELCNRAMTLDPAHADSMCLLGEVCLHSGQFDQALDWVTRAVRIQPNAAYVSTLGTILVRLGRLEEGLKAFEKAITIAPENAEIWKNFGAALIEMNRPDQAFSALGQALRLRPSYVDAANLYGRALLRQERYVEALEYFNLSLEVEPGQADVLQVRALVLMNLGRLEDSVADSSLSARLNPTDADTYNLQGHVLGKLGRYEESLAIYDRALELRPNYALALCGKASSLAELRRIDQALACYKQCLAVHPTYPWARWDLALLQMLVGSFDEGWLGREVRWELGLISVPKFPQPLWTGDGSLVGKTILLYADEGIGDMFQFARYLPMVAKLGARIVLVVDSTARSMMSRMSGVSECISKQIDILPTTDVHSFISSLPLAFKTTPGSIPATVPYLPTPTRESVEKWKQRLGAHDQFRVGLVWSGNAAHANDHNRSMPLQELTKLLQLDAKFISLQKDPRDRDRQALAGSTVIDMTEHLSDFDETLALMSCLDLVISVDTSVAHLAGGGGLPVWILLPYTPDYRWMFDRDDTPWYPTARLFRQSEERQWSGVLEKIRVELGALIEDWGSGRR